MTDWDGLRYQEHFDNLAAAGKNVHGEADFVMAFRPTSVLDAGCGTGRVAIELARRGVEVVGVDQSAEMLSVARERAPEIRWVLADMAEADLARHFDVVVMAGNVPLFTAPGAQAALVAGCARHLRPKGVLVAGFQLDDDYGLDDYDAHCEAAGLTLEERWSTWERDGWSSESGYAVSVHRRGA